MNQRLPYEKLIAEKLKDTPVPDEQKAWPRMNALLDREMPVGETKVQKRPGNKWWWAGGLVIVMVTGVWISFLFTNEKSEPVPRQVQNTFPVATQSANDAQSTPDKKNVLDNALQQLPKYNPEVTAGKKSRELKLSQSAVEPALQESAKTQISYSAAKNTGVDPNKMQSSAPPGNKTAVTPPLAYKPVLVVSANGSKNNCLSNTRPIAGPFIATPFSQVPDLQSFIPASEIAITLNAVTGKTPVMASMMPVTIDNTTVNENISIIKSLADQSSGTLPKSDLAALLPDVRTERKKLLREIKRQERKEERALSKSYRTYHSFWGEAPDRWFAAGIAPYQNFAIASQQSYHYNAAAGKNIITDYIPSPYLQLHVTNRVYLLSEFQFNSPQYTAPLLLSQRKMTIPAANTNYTEQIYLRKLYYFNMPVSFYYSPIRNFYLGSGLQFSSFASGLADLEQRNADNRLLFSERIKLKDDTLSAKFSNTEWRYLFDANYYHGRFMVGFRYNQALNHLIDSDNRFGSTAVRARNQAFQFYIRYNLVVSGRRP